MNGSEHGRSSLRRLRSGLARRSARLRSSLRPDAGDLEERLVWIMGSPRTGSTWILNLLGWLTNAPMIDEPLIGTHLATSVAAITGRPGKGTDDLITDVSRERPDYFFSDAHADAWVPALRDLMLRRFGSGLPAERDHRLVFVKEPHGSLGAPILLRCLPTSRLLYLVRDGRDVVDSILDGIDGGWIADSFGLDVDQYGGRKGLLATRAEQWTRDMAGVQAAYDQHDPSRRMMLRYEDMLADPVEQLARVLDWLGRPQEREQIQAVVDRLSSDNVPAESRGPGKFVRAATSGLWRSHFDEGEQALLNEIMAPTLARLGYR